MRVVLLAHTPDPERVVAAAARQCYSPRAAAEIFAHMEEAGTADFVQRLVERGHASVIEHASFTFAIEGVSRALTHQLVRSRIASFSQQSQRYVGAGHFEYVTPPSIERNAEATALFQQTMAALQSAYQKLVDFGVPKEDARYVLPNAAASKIVVTMNARSLLHFFELRLCERAQWEIRHLAHLMLSEVRRVAPDLFRHAGPTCITQKICREGDPACPRLKVLKDVRLLPAGERAGAADPTGDDGRMAGEV